MFLSVLFPVLCCVASRMEAGCFLGYAEAQFFQGGDRLGFIFGFSVSVD